MMKRLFPSILLLMLVLCLCACQATSKAPDDSESSEQESESQTEQEWMQTACSTESVDVFWEIIEGIQGESLLAGYVLTKEKCFDVTPANVASETDCKIFKFSDSCASFVMIDNEVYTLCEWFGGYGFVNAVPCDFDNDGNKDLLVASSWGSGLHRSVISVFNVTTKASTVIYDTSTTDHPQMDLFVARSTPSSSSEDPSALPVYYLVYSAKIEPEGDNFAKLSYCTTGVVGAIVVENGEIVFRSAEKP